MIISICDEHKRPIGVTDARKIQRINIQNDKLIFIFDNELVSEVDFGHAPYDELATIIDALKTMEHDVTLYNVKDVTFSKMKWC